MATVRALPNSIGARSPALALLIIVAIAAVLTLVKAGHLLSPSLWLSATIQPSPGDPAQLLFHHSFLPRIAIALIAGAALALAGVIFQHVLRNPLAEPATLGVSAGAQLSLSLEMLWAPWLLSSFKVWVAMGGGTFAALFVLWLAARSAFAPTTILTAGLLISLICGSSSAVLVVLNHDFLNSLFFWQSGSLVQNGWAPANDLLVQTVALAMLCALVIRPLELLGLGDSSARSLGLSIELVRIIMLAIAVGLTACVTSAVGVIGFIGLAAPLLARSLGARTLRQRMAWAPLLGAGLLGLTDQAVQAMSFFPQEIPTGAATGLLAAPVLIWFLRRLKTHVPPHIEQSQRPRIRLGLTSRLVVLSVIALAACLLVAFFVEQSAGGWRIAGWSDVGLLYPWRAPRMIAAIACGAMLSASGVILQRMTGNPMASPEVLGISSGATVAVILSMLLLPGFDPSWTFPAACAGAAITLVTLLWTAGKSGFAPDQLLITGVAIASLSAAISSIALASGDPRTTLLLTWMSGSTYGMTASQAVVSLAIAIATMAIAPLAVRWLAILPLGASSAQALGVNVAIARLGLLLIVCISTAAATLIIGPLSFVGLLAPHLVRMAGVHRPLPQLFTAAIAGAIIMLLADWLGRNIFFPWQIPAGLIASLIGAPFFLWLLRRRSV